MSFFLVERDGEFFAEFELGVSKVTIGRRGDPGPERLLLDDPTISTNHAVLERHGNQFMVQDLHSRNGIMLNGELLPPGRLYPLQEGDCLQVCDFTLELKGGEPSSAKPAPAAEGGAPPPAKPAEGPAEGLPSSLGPFVFRKVYSPRDVVGGDFFAAQVLGENRLALALGDATGGEDPVVEVTLRCTEEARRLVKADTSPPEAAAALHQALGEIYPGRPVTFLFGVLDVGDSAFQFVNAGHPTPVVFRRSDPRQVRRLLARGEPLVGGGEEAPAPLQETRLPFQEGDTMVFFTDGILNASPLGQHDAENRWKNEIRETLMASWGLGLSPFLETLKKKMAEAEKGMGPFGFEGVAAAIASHGGEGIKVLLPAIEGALRGYLVGGEPGDDVTLIGFERMR
ncbi:MAG: SpoIIE family protein phosphatase [Planctomycetota bacterium]|jgi:pSer/pThr/pTyr-binding forkhead associated (FHA) protein